MARAGPRGNQAEVPTAPTAAPKPTSGAHPSSYQKRRGVKLAGVYSHNHLATSRAASYLSLETYLSSPVRRCGAMLNQTQRMDEHI